MLERVDGLGEDAVGTFEEGYVMCAQPHARPFVVVPLAQLRLQACVICDL